RFLHIDIFTELSEGLVVLLVVDLSGIVAALELIYGIDQLFLPLVFAFDGEVKRSREIHVIGGVLGAPHPGEEGFMSIVGILFGILVVVYDHIFLRFLVLFIFRFIVGIRIIGIQSSVDL